MYDELYDDNAKFEFSSYPKTHSNFTRNIIGYTDDNKPSVYNAKVPAKFKEDFEFKIPIEMSVCKPKSWTANVYDKSEHESNIETQRGKCVQQQIVEKTLQYDDLKTCLTNGDIKYNDCTPFEALTINYIHFIVIK